MNETRLATSNNRYGNAGGNTGSSTGLRHSRSMLDRAALLQHFDGDMDLLCEIAETFLEHAPMLLAEIAAATAARSPERLRSAAHSLKGSVANFGAQDAVAAAFRLESMGTAGLLEGVDAVYADLLTYMEALQVELADLVKLHS